MANPNPSPATRFVPGQTGRAKQKGTRDRMSAAFLAALADDFEAHGKEAVEKVRQDDPSTYLRIFATLAPKEMEISRPLDGISDELLDKVIAVITAAVGGQEDTDESATTSVN